MIWPSNASYFGGISPGARVFAVDGDFTIAEPCSPPMIRNSFKGDSPAETMDIILLDSFNDYVRVPVGFGYNVQPFSPNQTAIEFEQEFVVALAYFVPLPLNTLYNGTWSIGWQNNYVALQNCFLVEEGPLEPIGGGLVKFRRRFANLPPNWNRFESFTYTYPAIHYDDNDGGLRFQKPLTVSSRVQFDYFVFDDLDILPLALFPAGHRLNGSTGTNPTGLILPQMRFFKSAAAAVDNNNLLDADQPLDDGPPPTVPSKTEYLDWIQGSVHGQAEIVAESSILSQWQGNIYERRTRFVPAF